MSHIILCRKLPHPIYTEQSEICLFTKDFDRSDVEATEEKYKEKFQSVVGFVPKVCFDLCLFQKVCDCQTHVCI